MKRKGNVRFLLIPVLVVMIFICIFINYHRDYHGADYYGNSEKENYNNYAEVRTKYFEIKRIDENLWRIAALEKKQVGALLNRFTPSLEEALKYFTHKGNAVIKITPISYVKSGDIWETKELLVFTQPKPSR